MSTKVLIGVFSACVCVAVSAAQSQAPAPRPSDNPASSAAANMLTIQGCVERSPQGTGVPGSAAATASGSSFMLTNVTKPTGTSGSTGGATSGTTASAYRLDAEDSKLSPHVGHKVELTGMIEAQAGSPS